MKDIKKKIFAVIINYNGSRDTVECLESLLKVDNPEMRIIVVDNGSMEADANTIKDNLPQGVNGIFLDVNLGFSGGNNAGIKEAVKNNAEYVLLLNNDTVVEKDFLEKLLAAADKHPEAGIIAPQINYYSDREVTWAAGGYISRLRGSGFSNHENKKGFSVTENKYITFASGCCLLIKSEVFEKAGYLDEKYFLYLEDTDFCLRASNANYKILLAAGSKIYHKVNSSTARENSLLPIYYTTRNRLYFSEKLPGIWPLAARAYIYITMRIKFAAWFLGDQKERTRAVKKAFRDFQTGVTGQVEGL